MLLVLDNHDSFTWNLVQDLWRLGVALVVRQSDAGSATDLLDASIDRVLVAPGPGRPAEAGASQAVIAAALRRGLPLLGVCLGHECLAACGGAQIRRARQPVHGRTSVIRHDGSTLFRGVPQTLRVARYHSLVVETPLPHSLLPLAWSCDDGELMALRHRHAPAFGVQFHPESFLTEHGTTVLRNFMEIPV